MQRVVVRAGEAGYCIAGRNHQFDGITLVDLTDLLCWIDHTYRFNARVQNVDENAQASRRPSGTDRGNFRWCDAVIHDGLCRIGIAKFCAGHTAEVIAYAVHSLSSRESRNFLAWVTTDGAIIDHAAITAIAITGHCTGGRLARRVGRTWQGRAVGTSIGLACRYAVI